MPACMCLTHTLLEDQQNDKVMTKLDASTPVKNTWKALIHFVNKKDDSIPNEENGASGLLRNYHFWGAFLSLNYPYILFKFSISGYILEEITSSLIINQFCEHPGSALSLGNHVSAMLVRWHIIQRFYAHPYTFARLVCSLRPTPFKSDPFGLYPHREQDSSLM